MGGIGKKSKPPKQESDKSKKPPPPVPADDDDLFEDGDIATPKRDRYGDDDQPI
jgi:hypothetical protein